MRYIKILFITVLLISSVIVNAQQRPTFSTYVYNGLALNPAYAGSQNMFSVIFTNRNQWINIDGAPNFQSITAQTTWKDNQIGTGLNITRDAIGSYEVLSVYGSYAYKIKMARNILSMGLQGGFDYNRADFSAINLSEQGDPLFDSFSKFNPNFGAGIYCWHPPRIRNNHPQIHQLICNLMKPVYC